MSRIVQRSRSRQTTPTNEPSPKTQANAKPTPSRKSHPIYSPTRQETLPDSFITPVYWPKHSPERDNRGKRSLFELSDFI
jgi:hypothetical protein